MGNNCGCYCDEKERTQETNCFVNRGFRQSRFEVDEDELANGAYTPSQGKTIQHKGIKYANKNTNKKDQDDYSQSDRMYTYGNTR